MSPRPIKDVAASVRQRLLNRARAEGRPFQELLQYYAMERFLFRLSKSEHAHSFILKGALMLRIWRSPECRSTMDIDLLGRTSNDLTSIARQVLEILCVEVEPDGLRFDATSMRAERITEDADYAGIRVLLSASLGSAKVKIQLDVGLSTPVSATSHSSASGIFRRPHVLTPRLGITSG